MLACQYIASCLEFSLVRKKIVTESWYNFPFVTFYSLHFSPTFYIVAIFNQKKEVKNGVSMLLMFPPCGSIQLDRLLQC